MSSIHTAMQITEIKAQIEFLQRELGNTLLELSLDYQLRIDVLLKEIEQLQEKELLQ